MFEITRVNCIINIIHIPDSLRLKLLFRFYSEEKETFLYYIPFVSYCFRGEPEIKIKTKRIMNRGFV